MSQVTLESIGEAFFRAEAEEDLYNWRAGGYDLWPIMRSRLLKELIVNSGQFKPEQVKAPLVTPPRPVEYHGRQAALLLFAKALGFPLKPRKDEIDFRNLDHYKAIIVPFYNRNANHEDKFSKPVADYFGDEGFTFGVGRYDRKGRNPRLEDYRILFWGLFGIQARVAVRLMLKRADYERYARVVKILESSGATLGNYSVLPRWLLAKFVAQAWGFKRVFQAFKADKIYCINAAHMSMNAGAQAAGKKIIELQSGVFSRYSLQISWPGSPAIKYLPNEIWTWGEYFTEDLERPKDQVVRILGCTVEFDNARKADIKRIDNRVAIFAQPMVGLQLLDFAIEFAALRPDLEIIFKLHPSNIKDHFEERLAREKTPPKNLKLITNEETSLHLIRQSKYSVGVFSTSLIEAAGLGSIPVVVNFAGWQHLAPLVNHKYAELVTNPQDLASRMDGFKPNENPEHFYGELTDWEKLLSS